MKKDTIAITVLGVLAVLLAVILESGMRQRQMATRNVIVIGGGLAGLSAAIEASIAGARVHLLDKEPRVGGNSAKASSGINAIFTEAQRRDHIPDSVEAFTRDTIVSGHGKCNQQLVDVIVNESTSAVEFLTGLNVNLKALSKCGGHSFPRTHRALLGPEDKVSNVGWDIIAALQKVVTSKDVINIIPGARVTDLLFNAAGHVDGVRYTHTPPQPPAQPQQPPAAPVASTTEELRGDAVVLATGGFAADSKGFLPQYAPAIANLATTNGPWATGDGVRLASAIGAGLIDMDQVQVHPTGFVDPKAPNAPTKFLAPEALRACGAILVNKKGERFINELGRRDDVSNSIMANCEPLNGTGPRVGYMILNNEAAHNFQQKMFEFYKARGFITSYANAEEMSAQGGFDFEAIKNTITEYTAVRAGNAQDRFGKDTLTVGFTLEEPLHVALITPCIHYTMGGVRFNTEAQVLKEDGSVISGLFAAGEVTGGLHGANRLAGNSLLECVVFGRRAGRNASAKM